MCGAHRSLASSVRSSQLQRNVFDFRRGVMVKCTTPVRFPLVLDFDRAIGGGSRARRGKGGRSGGGGGGAKAGSKKPADNDHLSDRACAVCGAVAASKCTRCRKVWYCSKECQRSAWFEHKKTCAVESASEAKGEPNKTAAASAEAAAAEEDDRGEEEPEVEVAGDDDGEQQQDRKQKQRSAGRSGEAVAKAAASRLYELVAVVLHHGGGPQHGLQPATMALITSDCDAMRSPSIKWP